jgi:hypothetical protein
MVIKTACERFGVSLETRQRQERAFGLLRKVYAKRAVIRGQSQMPGFTEYSQGFGVFDLNESNDEYFY